MASAAGPVAGERLATFGAFDLFAMAFLGQPQHHFHPWPSPEQETFCWNQDLVHLICCRTGSDDLFSLVAMLGTTTRVTV